MEITVAQVIGLLSVTVTAFSIIMVAYISKRKSPGEIGAIKAGTLSSLIKSIQIINDELDDEREERIKDCVNFEKQLVDLREFYSQKLKVVELQGQNQIESLKQHYEERIARLEQAHRDRVNSMKERIRALENETLRR